MFLDALSLYCKVWMNDVIESGNLGTPTWDYLLFCMHILYMQDKST